MLLEAMATAQCCETPSKKMQAHNGIAERQLKYEQKHAKRHHKHAGHLHQCKYLRHGFVVTCALEIRKSKICFMKSKISDEHALQNHVCHREETSYNASGLMSNNAFIYIMKPCK